MTGAESNNDMFTNIRTLGGGDVEAGNNSGHLNDLERNSKQLESSLTKIPDGGSYQGHVDHIDKWAGSLARILEDVPKYMCSTGHPGRISKIPESLLEAAVKAYEPYIFSFGPYHHNKPMVRLRERSKQAILKCFLEQKPEVTLKDYLMELKCIESTARSFYSDVEMDREKFVKMMLLDGIFILSKFCGIPRSWERKVTITGTESRVVIEEVNEIGFDNENMQLMVSSDELNDETSDPENYVNPPALFWPLFLHDLFLLENQLPFFVLQKVYDLAYGNPKTQLIDIMKCNISQMLSVYTKPDSKMVISPHEEVHHLLHLCHMFFRPTLHPESVTFQPSLSNQIFRLGSAVQLYEEGVRFEATSDSTQHSLLDITVGNSGNIVIPCLYVDDNLDSLLRNLIALEQMKYPRLGLDISAYVVLFSSCHNS